MSLRVLIYGATGMVGQGALRACLADPDVERVLAIVRTPTGQSHPKYRELIRPDVGDSAGIEGDLTGFDACLFCLGVSSAGMDEASYTRITYDLTLRVAETLCRLNPAMTFVFVSGASADSSEKGRVMWARVKGRTENALRRLPFKAVYVFRPGAIQALHGIKSKTAAYRLAYIVLGPLLAVLRPILPRLILTTDSLGRAMIAAARSGAPKGILDPPDIFELARRA